MVPSPFYIVKSTKKDPFIHTYIHKFINIYPVIYISLSSTFTYTASQLTKYADVFNFTNIKNNILCFLPIWQLSVVRNSKSFTSIDINSFNVWNIFLLYRGEWQYIEFLILQAQLKCTRNQAIFYVVLYKYNDHTKCIL